MDISNINPGESITTGEEYLFDGLQRAGITEKDAQEYIINYLIKSNGFIRGGANESYKMNLYLDPHTGIDINILSEFIRSTQPEVWNYFSKYPEPLKELEAVVVSYKISMGTLEIITNGIPREHDRPEIKICYNKSSLNENQNEFWGKNLFIVYDEVKYQDTQNPNKRIDIVLAVNGIPIISTELKNELSGQGNEHGEEQFKATRSNLEPILRPVTGCLLYFSMSLREVSLTTSLKGINTKFLPFNKGFNGGKGNPPVDDKPEYNGFRTHYMLDEIWTKDNLTDILFNYMFVDKNGSNLSELTTDELMNVNVIAPRYNQLSLVTKVINDLIKGDITNAPKKFLIQHSPGSGKTLSITWLAHRLVRLLSKQKSNFFDHVIVVTDRVVVVNQLDRSIRLLNKHAGMVAEVKNSRELVKALNNNKKIIVTTIQKFGKLKSLLDDLSVKNGKNFALIIDEAHSGQTGENSAALIDILGKSLSDEAAELNRDIDNITYFAFTATPKPETLFKFGIDNKPYHLYSMKQAIEEKQILNVLKNYTHHSIFNKIYNLGENEILPSSIYAKRAMNDYIRSSKENLEYKVAVILEHMITGTLCNIGGLGRGMLVVSSRMDVYKYFKEINRQISLYPDLYGKIKPMGAFTDSIIVDGKNIRDNDLNGFSDTEIETRLADEDNESDYMRNLLIVADKFQTGFSEPLLCSMYVDKKLSGINAVQTLSRLNRIRLENDKEDVVILDFQDNEDDIREAFASYGVEARVKTYTTLADLEKSALAIYTYGILSSEQVNSYYNASKLVGIEKDSITKMSNIVNQILDSLDAYRNTDEKDLRETYSKFIYEIRSYIEDFTFVSQFKIVGNSNLRGLQLLLKLISRLVKAPSGRRRDNSWLENIDVKIAQTTVTQRNISPLSDELDGINERNRLKTGATGLNPNDYDKPISIEELVEEYNKKLKTIILSANGALKNISEAEISKRVDEYNIDVFDKIIEMSMGDKRLENFSKNHSSQRFDCENTRKIINEIILNALMEDKKENLNTPNYINLPKLYNDNSEFKDNIQKFVLNSIYPMFIKKNIDDSKVNKGTVDED